MASAAATAFVTSLVTSNPLIGLIAGIAMGILLSALHAFFSVSLRANQVLSGLAITILGLGLSSLIGRGYVGLRGVGIEKLIHIPVLEDIPVLGALSGLDPLAYIGIIASIILWYILYKTSAGLILQSVGEDPDVAASLGHNVFRIRYYATIFGGAMAGLAGAHLTLAVSPGWFEGITAGRGWIALGIVILGSWNPLRTMLAAYFIGAVMELRFLLAPYLGVSGILLDGLPYLLVVVMLAIVSIEGLRKRVGAPASLGKPYPED